MADQNDFEEGARRALAWLGRSEDGAELAQIVGQMPTKLGDVEVAFLIAIGRAALAGHKAAPQTEAEAKIRPATPSPPAEGDGGLSQGEFWQRVHDRERKARLDELLRRNAERWRDQPLGGADWRGW
jgi:hypothetical protein